jgi:xanthine dehydrogenase accessory factor
MTNFFEKVAALSREGQSFAVATVVARRPPVSAHLGDRAIIFADGRMEGFVGGACSREIVRRQALESLRLKQARLVSIRPDAADTVASDPEHVIVPMSCASEGAVDVYVEPFLRARRLVVVGATPVAEALAKLAAGMNYDVVRVVEAAEQGDLQSQPTAFSVAPIESLASVIREGPADVAAVVASQGHYDEEALEAILTCDVPYVGLVASRKRGATVRTYLEQRGAANAASVRIPAGLDLGGRTAPEVALSILAEIVQTSPRNRVEPTVPAPAVATAVDPVCGMTVDVATAKHTAELDGAPYYFCCAQCRARFVKDPHPFLPARA